MSSSYARGSISQHLLTLYGAHPSRSPSDDAQQDRHDEAQTTIIIHLIILSFSLTL